MGETDLTQSEILQLVKNMGNEYKGNHYHLLQRNCNNFASDLCHALVGKPAPAWVRMGCMEGLPCGCLVEHACSQGWHHACMVPRELVHMHASSMHALNEVQYRGRDTTRLKPGLRKPLQLGDSEEYLWVRCVRYECTHRPAEIQQTHERMQLASSAPCRCAITHLATS